MRRSGRGVKWLQPDLARLCVVYSCHASELPDLLSTQAPGIHQGAVSIENLTWSRGADTAAESDAEAGEEGDRYERSWVTGHLVIDL